MNPRPRVTIVNSFLVLSLAGFAHFAMAQPGLAQSLDKSQGAVAASGAVPLMEKTLLAAVTEAAQWKPLDPRVAKAHEDLADFYAAEGRYPEAEKVY